LADSAEKDIASKSLYLLAHIEKQNGDSTLADSLYRILIERYGDTEYGMVVGKRLGIPIIQDKIDSGEVIFLEAERLYFTEDLPEMALIQYALVDSLYPQSPYAPKALYARAWIEEKEWRQDSTALTLLNKLVDNYPKDTLAVLTKKRLTRPTTSQAQTSTTSIDTTSEITSEQVYNIDEVDTPPICAEDSTAISALILSNRLYPSAALSAQKKGLVILKLTINKYGYPEDLEIAKEIPPGYQFGEKALEVVQLLHFTPGKIKNKLVAVRMEQRIKFEI
jgi:TonB family protein